MKHRLRVPLRDRLTAVLLWRYAIPRGWVALGLTYLVAAAVVATAGVLVIATESGSMPPVRSGNPVPAQLDDSPSRGPVPR